MHYKLKSQGRGEGDEVGLREGVSKTGAMYNTKLFGLDGTEQSKTEKG